MNNLESYLPAKLDWLIVSLRIEISSSKCFQYES